MSIGVWLEKRSNRGRVNRRSSRFFFFKQKTAYEIGTGDWSSDVCSSDLADSNPNVRVYSNCEEVELYLNDSLVSKSRPNQEDRKSVV